MRYKGKLWQTLEVWGLVKSKLTTRPQEFGITYPFMKLSMSILPLLPKIIDLNAKLVRQKATKSPGKWVIIGKLPIGF